MDRKKTFLSPMSTLETIYGSDPVKRFQLMAQYWKVKVRWMSPCLLANQCR